MGSLTEPGSHLLLQNGADLTHIRLNSWTLETEVDRAAILAAL